MELILLLRAWWRSKWLLFLGAGLPALVLGAISYFSPRTYRCHLSYPMTLNAVQLKKLTERFYSATNLTNLAVSLRKAGAAQTAALLEGAESQGDLRGIVDIQVTPSYVDFDRRENLKLSLERSWAENVEKLESLEAHLLTIHLKTSPREELQILLAQVRYNMEQHLPLHEVQDTVRTELFNINNELADQKRNRIYVLQKLEGSRSVLAELQEIPGKKAAKPSGSEFTLSFSDLEKDSRYLPLDLQIQIQEAEIARLKAIGDDHRRKQEQLAREAAVMLILRDHLKAEMADNYGLEAYTRYVTELRDQTSEPHSRELLDAHYLKTANYSLGRLPLTSGSRLVPLARGTIRLTLMSFCVLMMAGLLIISLRAWIISQDDRAP